MSSISARQMCNQLYEFLLSNYSLMTKYIIFLHYMRE